MCNIFPNFQVNPDISNLSTEKCYHVEVSSGVLGDDKVAILQWILKEPQQSDGLSRQSILDDSAEELNFVIEIGPR